MVKTITKLKSWRLLLLVQVLLTCDGVRETPKVTWSKVKAAFKPLIAEKPILVVFSHFDFELDFFKTFPSQQILARPNRVLGRCPHERILLLSSLHVMDFMLKFSKFRFHLCPLGTVYYLLGNLKLHAYNQFSMLPYTADNDAMRKGLFFATSMYPHEWLRDKKPVYPPTWREDFLNRKANLKDINSGSLSVFSSYEIDFMVGNLTPTSYSIEGRLQPVSHLISDRESPVIFIETPVVVAVYRPQSRTSLENEFFAVNSNLVFVVILSLAIAMFTRYHSEHRNLLSHLVFTSVASLFAVIPLKNLRGDIKLLVTFGLWLFLSQVFISILMGDIIKGISVGPQDKIRSIKLCEPNLTLESPMLEQSVDGRRQRNRGSELLLSYKHLCLVDLLDAKPFLTYFEKTFPLAELYHVQHMSSSKLILIDAIHVQSFRGYSLRGLILRVHICHVRGNLYVQRLMQGGLFYASKLMSYRYRASYRIL